MTRDTADSLRVAAIGAVALFAIVWIAVTDELDWATFTLGALFGLLIGQMIMCIAQWLTEKGWLPGEW